MLDPSKSGTNEAQTVNLTVTNVVMQYVLNSIQPDIVLPQSADTGFVTVIAEVKGSVVSVPNEWAANYPCFEEKFGSDFAVALTKETGKRDGAGNPMLVWQDYVAGTDPTDETDVFTASITIAEGKPIVSWTPELSAEQAATRVYIIYGKAKLTDAEWKVVDGNAGDYNFFKVSVEMK